MGGCGQVEGSKDYKFIIAFQIMKVCRLRYNATNQSTALIPWNISKDLLFNILFYGILLDIRGGLWKSYVMDSRLRRDLAKEGCPTHNLLNKAKVLNTIKY